MEGHPFREIQAQPAGPTTPEVWILGSSDYGAQVAAYFGLPFCFAHFITDGQGVDEALAVYRDGYRPSAAPRSTCGGVRLGDGRADAGRSCVAVPLARNMAARPGPRDLYRPAVTAGGCCVSAIPRREMARIERLRARAFYGTADVVGGRLRDLATQLASRRSPC